MKDRDNLDTPSDPVEEPQEAGGSENHGPEENGLEEQAGVSIGLSMEDYEKMQQEIGDARADA